MGWAKYMEDNIEIFNNRMYDRGADVLYLNDFKKEQKKNSSKEEYLSALKELKKLDIHLDIINELLEMIGTDFIIEFIEDQKTHFNKIKDEYIDYLFDPKFRNYRNGVIKLEDLDFREYELKIIESYIRYFVDKLKSMENVTNHDSIVINNIYWDIEAFMQRFTSIDIKLLTKPLVQYLREDILGDNEERWFLCSNCGEKTYRDFKFCINCKYPVEVR